MDQSPSNRNGPSSISTIIADSVKTLDGSSQSAHSEVQGDRFYLPRSSNPNGSSIISISPRNQLLVPSLSDGSRSQVLVPSHIETRDYGYVVSSDGRESSLPSPTESQDNQCLVPVTVDPLPRVTRHGDGDNCDDHKSPMQIESARGPSSSLGARLLDGEHNEEDFDDTEVNFEKDRQLSERPCGNRYYSCNCNELLGDFCGPRDPAYHRRGPCGQCSDFQFHSEWNSPWQPSRDRWGWRRENRETVVTGVGAGLSNLGNTCFINAILQCFTHTVSFVKALNSCNHLVPCQRGIEGFCAVCTLHEHIEASLASSGKIISPSKVVDNLNHISSCFYRYQQEDAHEFLQCLLDKLERCLNSNLNNETSSSENDNIVKCVFGGRLVSKLLCCNCGHFSDKYEPLIDLSLEIEDVKTLQDALESFTKVEKIEDSDTKFRCDNCKEEVSREKQLMLDQAPSVATLHLKRFKTDGSSVEKIGKHVEFPLYLDLKPYTNVSQESDDSQVNLKYHLYATVVHNGSSPTSGHYFCYVRSSPNTWHKLDDSMVIRVDEEVVLSDAAYILFYAREGTAWFSSLMESQKDCLDLSNTSPKSVLDSMDTECTAYPHLANIDDCKASATKSYVEGGSVTIMDVEGASAHSSNVTVLEADQINETGNAAEGLSAHVNEAGNGTEEFSAHISCGSRQSGLKLCCDKSRPGILANDVSVSLGAIGCHDGTLHKEKMDALPSIDGNNCGEGANRNERNGFHPLTPPRSKSPDVNFGGFSETRHHIRQDNLKLENSLNYNRSKRATNDERMEAVRLTRSMPSARKNKLLAAMNPQIDKKRRLRSSPCKQASLPGSRRKLNHRLAALH
ncbi:ubiquitin carboxyl-terminal hydrolase 20 isoform X2 [Hevea brasiliensis]|uniref:ubiquitin carboxyl-terminal hydrolase 20 isoform X2 n=1 Tax=Hevea brasiliensis TaxID=3981 RepID=UPI0025D99385|nr:ubiquitin carboxyl-terminal hydrolase 20 isoform X2 [Hevea brasiliensis]